MAKRRLRKSERERFTKSVVAMLEARGAVQTEEPSTLNDGTSYRLEMPTKYGPLAIHVCETISRDPGTVFTRFEYAKLGAGRLGGNEYSGKWNHHFSQDQTVDFALECLEGEFDRILPTPYHFFTEATAILPEVIAKTVIENRRCDLIDPPYHFNSEGYCSHEAAVEWFAQHVVQRVIFLYDNNQYIHDFLTDCECPDIVYAFVEHWLDAYIDNPVEYRKRCPMAQKTMLV